MLINYDNGMTVKDLKVLIKDWPELDENGDDSEVWIGFKDGTSNQVFKSAPLGRSDLILE